MKKVNFWIAQIVMVAIVSLAFGSPVFAAPKAGKTATTATADEEVATHGEDMRLENANLDEGNATWKSSEPPPPSTCSVDSPELCTSEQECLDAGGAIWFNEECLF